MAWMHVHACVCAYVHVFVHTCMHMHECVCERGTGIITLLLNIAQTRVFHALTSSQVSRFPLRHSLATSAAFPVIESQSTVMTIHTITDTHSTPTTISIWIAGSNISST